MARQGRQGRYQVMERFWLNHNNRHDLEIADTIEILKNERAFTKTVKQGIMLMVDLRAGRVDVLTALFPWVASAFAAPPASADDDPFRRIEQRLDDLDALMRASADGLRPGAPKRKLAGLSEDAPDVVVMKNTSTSSADNFLASLKGLQSLGSGDTKKATRV